MRKKGPTALLVEDDPDDRELILRALRKAGIAFDVDVAHDGEEALDWIFASGIYAWRDSLDLPQVVLLDLNLPKLGGLEVLRRIRAHARTREVPVVIFTSSVEEEDIVRSYGLGANSFIRKPAGFEPFVEAFRQLRRLGLYWLMASETPPARRGKPA